MVLKLNKTSQFTFLHQLAPINELGAKLFKNYLIIPIHKDHPNAYGLYTKIVEGEGVFILKLSFMWHW